MGMIDDILKALDRIPIWKRVQELPAEIDALPNKFPCFQPNQKASN